MSLSLRPLRYLLAYSLPLIVWFGLNSFGVWTFIPVIYGYLLVPLIELWIGAEKNTSYHSGKELKINNVVYDLLIIGMFPVQLGLVLYFVVTIGQGHLSGWEIAGRVSAMGLCCGSLAINVGHELGHRRTKVEHFMAKILLMTSLYMHFYIEHNRGHHRNIATPEDPATARKGETLYSFWLRSMLFSLISAWKLEKEKLKKNNQAFWSLHNEMLRFGLIQLSFLGLIYACFGWFAMLMMVAAAFGGILQLETVNYIEHYGLQRIKLSNGNYEPVTPWHSWDSNHWVSRLLLFELSRHADHHYRASKKYHTLYPHQKAPQMPTGYSGMMILAMFPPLWFKVMHKSLELIKKSEKISALK